MSYNIARKTNRKEGKLVMSEPSKPRLYIYIIQPWSKQRTETKVTGTLKVSFSVGIRKPTLSSYRTWLKNCHSTLMSQHT